MFGNKNIIPFVEIQVSGKNKDLYLGAKMVCSSAEKRLKYISYALYYFKPDGKHVLEFLIEKYGEVVPVEVKARIISTAKLNRVIEKYSPTISYKFMNGSVGLSGVKIIYMITFL